jgi:hypothetical protein
MVKLTKLLKTVSKGLVVWVIYNPALTNWPQIAKIKMPQTQSLWTNSSDRVKPPVTGLSWLIINEYILLKLNV